MSSATEHRPQTGPRYAADDTTVAMPRPTGPFGPPPAPMPQGPNAWAAPAPGWSAPPAGLGPVAPAGPAHDVPRQGLRWGWIVIAVVAAIAAVALIGTVAASSRSMDVHGTVTIYGMSGYVTPGSGCTSTLAYGMPVTIYDASGDIVGTTSLTGSGIARTTWSSYSSYADSCEYAFTVSDVAATDDHYRVKAGSGLNDGVGFSREQLESGANVTLR